MTDAWETTSLVSAGPAHDEPPSVVDLFQSSITGDKHDATSGPNNKLATSYDTPVDSTIRFEKTVSTANAERAGASGAGKSTKVAGTSALPLLPSKFLTYTSSKELPIGIRMRDFLSKVAAGDPHAETSSTGSLQTATQPSREAASPLPASQYPQSVARHATATAIAPPPSLANQTLQSDGLLPRSDSCAESAVEVTRGTPSWQQNTTSAITSETARGLSKDASTTDIPLSKQISGKKFAATTSRTAEGFGTALATPPTVTRTKEELSANSPSSYSSGKRKQKKQSPHGKNADPQEKSIPTSNTDTVHVQSAWSFSSAPADPSATPSNTVHKFGQPNNAPLIIDKPVEVTAQAPATAVNLRQPGNVAEDDDVQPTSSFSSRWARASAVAQ